MAKRPIFIPTGKVEHLVKEVQVDFEWNPGFTSTQKKKNIVAIHEAAAIKGFYPLLEISTKSEKSIGQRLSAFNLMITTHKNKRTFSVESAYQSSKVFEHGGPFIDLLKKPSIEAKRDIRLKKSGNLIAFYFFRKEYPLEPKTIFYDWLYIKTLNQNEHLADELINYQGFTDIEFNPNKSINCQAHSAALYSSLKRAGLLQDALESLEAFKEVLASEYVEHDENIKAQKVLI